MRANGLRGVSRRRAWVTTTRRDARQPPAPDLVKREFTADGPNQLWVADMTYIPTWAGFIYLAVVVDVWSRRIVGWSFGETMTSELVLAALNMALALRKPEGVIHHSDQGSQYTSGSQLRAAASVASRVPRQPGRQRIIALANRTAAFRAGEEAQSREASPLANSSGFQQASPNSSVERTC